MKLKNITEKIKYGDNWTNQQRIEEINKLIGNRTNKKISFIN